MIVLLITYLSSIFLVCNASIYNLKKVLVFVTILFAVVSFFIQPTESWDLYRHYFYIEFYGEQGLSWVLENRMNVNPLTHLLFWVFSFFNEPRFFVSFTVFIVYGAIFIILYRSTIRFNLSKREFLIIFLFVLANLNYLLIAGNCRIFILYSVIALLYYFEFVENRFHLLAFVFYIVSIFYHYAIALVLIPRFILYLTKREDEKVTYLVVALITVFYTSIIPLMNSSMLLQGIEEKVAGYQEYDTFGKLQYMNAIICVIFSIFAFLKAKKNKYIAPLYFVNGFSVFLILLLQINEFQVVYREACFVSSLAIIPLAILKIDNNQQFMIPFLLQTVLTFLYCFVHDYSIIDFSFTL